MAQKTFEMPFPEILVPLEIWMIPEILVPLEFG
jgi:hypothetical protein